MSRDPLLTAGGQAIDPTPSPRDPAAVASGGSEDANPEVAQMLARMSFPYNAMQIEAQSGVSAAKAQLLERTHRR